RHSTRPEEVLRAWLEAVAGRLADALDALEGALGPADEVVASGGALHASTVWPGILADATGRRVVLSTVPEESCRGAALAALERLGAVADAAAMPPPAGRAYEPDPARHARYLAARARQREAEERLASLAPQ
ncbi:MAG TPA: FGGY-family carbohydrate kinase, partial [Longimicrobiaceae bacterium]